MHSANRGAVNRPTNSATAAGAVCEDQFRAAFEAVPEVKVTTLKDLLAECQKHAAILENTNNDWTKRIKALQMLRSLLKHDIGCYAAFAEQAFSSIGTALELSVKDLRSQVCRETCITIAYFCEKLGTGFWRCVEAVLPHTLNLTQNSAKVMATSGQICNVFIAKHIHHPKVLQIVVQNVSHKAKEIRRMSIAMVALIIGLWEPAMFERHAGELIQSVKTALSDADPEARATARQAFDNLQSHYPQRADALFQELEPAKQRLLVDRSSTASSTHSINSVGDNLPNPNRGLYSMQNAFLNKRSTSELNHAVRRLNLAPPRVQRSPAGLAVVKSGKPPQASAPSAQRFVPASSTPLAKRVPIAPNVNKVQKSASTISTVSNATKAASQPSSRSNSPSRNRQQQQHLQQVAAARSNIQAPMGSAKKIATNGQQQHNAPVGLTSTPLKAQPPSHKELTRALMKNVDIQSRRPNVIRSDDPRAYANSASAAANHTPRQSDSPQDFYGLSQKQEAALNRINSYEEQHALGSDRRRKSSSSANNSHGSLQTAKHEHLNSNEDNENTHNKWSHLCADQLAGDANQQTTFVQEVCDILSDHDANEKELEEALKTLTQMIRGEGIILWDQLFSNIFFSIQQVIAHPRNNDSSVAKILALKAMKELCIAQPKRLVTKTELLLINILDAHESEDATVVRAAEDCAAALASRLPTNTCMNLLLTVIDDRHSKYHQLSGAIKMLSNVIAKLPPEEVERNLPNVATRMATCYENSQSMVRRASIICLVSIANAVGIDNLKPHLTPSTLRLVEVYAQRMNKKDTSSS